MRKAVIGTVLVGWYALSAPSAVGQGLTPVPAANSKAPGVVSPNILSVELTEVVRARGAMLLENPVSPAKYYGYNDDHSNLVPLPGGSNVEATKTEPDKNTYLVLQGQHGADPNYDYGTHFLFQGHESGPGSPKKGYITRINLDADGPHRVTLMATTDIQGNSLPVFDGSTWHPWAQVDPSNTGSELPWMSVVAIRSEEHTSELQSQSNLVCRLLLEKKKRTLTPRYTPRRPCRSHGLSSC